MYRMIVAVYYILQNVCVAFTSAFSIYLNSLCFKVLVSLFGVIGSSFYFQGIQVINILIGIDICATKFLT